MSWFLGSVSSQKTILQRFHIKILSRTNSILKISLHMFLQIQSIYQKQNIKQSAWLQSTCSADSIGIKFAKIGRVDFKL